MSEKTIACLTIQGVGKMTKKGREQIAEWLISKADSVRYDDITTGRFTAKYIVLKKGE